ncbi:MAG: META domain-containing protein [Conchiformibius sp.]|nr:META domain-containing protein [Conchiformibius sp.]
MKHWATVAVLGGVLCACAPLSGNGTDTQAAAPSAVNAAAVKRVWMLTELDGFQKAQLVAAKAEMNWTRLPHANAYMGCNRMMFQADVSSDGRVKFGAVAATRMYCPDAIPLENAFGSLLPQMTRYRVEGHHLILEDGKGKTMRFVAQDWD